MTTIYLVRHGEAQANIDRVFQGHLNGPISENGKVQLAYLSKRFRKIQLSKIYTSPLQRAVETAKAINKTAELPLVMEPELMEIYGGGFEGKKFAELPDLYSEEWEAWCNSPHTFQAPGGESMRSVYDRMKRVILRIAHENMGKTVGVVSHGCALRNALCFAMDKPFDLLDEIPWGDNTCVSKLLFNDRFKMKVEYSNDNVHLPEELSTLNKQSWWKDKSRPEERQDDMVVIPSGELYLRDDDLHIVRAQMETPGGVVPLQNTRLFVEEGTVTLREDKLRLTETVEKDSLLVRLVESAEGVCVE